MDNLKNYVCLVPFQYMEIHHMGIYSCCPTWLPTKIGELDEISNIWESKKLKEVQDSILDGSYSHCSIEYCPALSQLYHKGIVEKATFIPREYFNIENYKRPRTFNYGFDRSCNLSCPSCRTEKIMANSNEIGKIDWIIKEIETNYGDDLQGLYLSGTADPFASKSFRKLLTDFDKNKYPKVNNIQLHTNGILFNKEMWDLMLPIQNLLTVIEISIDASTKETYNEVRRGGDWDVLIDNLKFISTLPLKSIRLSMVVQENNYMEMYDFYNLMYGIFGNKAHIFFKKISNWGTYTDEEFFYKEIHNPSHPEFNIFLLQLMKIDNKPNCLHSFHDVIDKHTKKKLKLI